MPTHLGRSLVGGSEYEAYLGSSDFEVVGAFLTESLKGRNSAPMSISGG